MEPFLPYLRGNVGISFCLLAMDTDSVIYILSLDQNDNVVFSPFTTNTVYTPLLLNPDLTSLTQFQTGTPIISSGGILALGTSGDTPVDLNPGIQQDYNLALSDLQAGVNYTTASSLEVYTPDVSGYSSIGVSPTGILYLNPNPVTSSGDYIPVTLSNLTLAVSSPNVYGLLTPNTPEPVMDSVEAYVKNPSNVFAVIGSSSPSYIGNTSTVLNRWTTTSAAQYKLWYNFCEGVYTCGLCYSTPGFGGTACFENPMLGNSEPATEQPPSVIPFIVSGPRGDTGSTGPAGSDGPQGPQGPQGVPGVSGNVQWTSPGMVTMLVIIVLVILVLLYAIVFGPRLFNTENIMRSSLPTSV